MLVSCRELDSKLRKRSLGNQGGEEGGVRAHCNSFTMLRFTVNMLVGWIILGRPRWNRTGCLCKEIQACQQLSLYGELLLIKSLTEEPLKI